MRLQHARRCHERFGIKLPKYPGKLELSAFIIATSIMATISSSSSGSSLPSVSHWSVHPLTRSFRAAEQDSMTEARSSEDWYFQLFQQLVKCLRAAIDQTAVWSFIHIGETQTSILLRSLCTKLLKEVFCYVRVVYLWLALTLAWHWMLGLRRGKMWF